MVDIAGTFLFDHLLPLKGNLEISRMQYGTSDPERGRGKFTVQAVKHESQDPVKVDILRSRQPSPIARI